MGLFDRIDRVLVIQEATYGFVMALTFVTANQLGLLHMGRNELVISILMMDFVWGVIDMIIFYDGDLIERHGRRRFLEHLYSTSDRCSMRGEVLEQLEGTVFEDLDDASKEKAVDLVINGRMSEDRGLQGTSGYLFNAVTAFAVTFGSAIPAALCILFVPGIHDALLAASLVSVVSLFFTGYFLAPTDRRIYRVLFGTGTAMLAFLLTLFAAYFGG